MTFNDLREFIRFLEAREELVRISTGVAPEFEIGATALDRYSGRGYPAECLKENRSDSMGYPQWENAQRKEIRRG